MPSCHDCGSANIEWDDRSSELVCGDCGLVAERVFDLTEQVTGGGRWRAGPAPPPTLGRCNSRKHVQHGSSPYNALFYFNERMSQYNLDSPRIPDEDWYRLEEAYYHRHGGDRTLARDVSERPRLCKQAVYALCRSVGLTKYADRWLAIRYELTGERPPLLSADVVGKMRLYFKSYLRVYYAHRPKNRKHRLSYNFVIAKLLHTVLPEHEATAHAAYFTSGGGNAAKMQANEQCWRAICAEARIPKKFLNQT